MLSKARAGWGRSIAAHMRKILNGLVFGAIELALAPVTLAETVLFYGKAGASARRTGMSYTAYAVVEKAWSPLEVA